MRVAAMGIALALLCGCASSDDIPPEGPLGPRMKTVTSKEAPSTLIAMDGTICNVAPFKFEGTRVGDRAWCDWRRRSEGPRMGGG